MNWKFPTFDMNVKANLTFGKSKMKINSFNFEMHAFVLHVINLPILYLKQTKTKKCFIFKQIFMMNNFN